MFNLLRSFVFSFWAVTLVLSSAEVARAENVCVRNFFPEGSEINPCGSHDSRFREVISADDDSTFICTKAYDTRLCQISAKEYRYVETVDHDVICTVNFHQEGVSQYCDTNPKVFSWARGR